MFIPDGDKTDWIPTGCSGSCRTRSGDFSGRFELSPKAEAVLRHAVAARSAELYFMMKVFKRDLINQMTEKKFRLQTSFQKLQ